MASVMPFALLQSCLPLHNPNLSNRNLYVLNKGGLKAFSNGPKRHIIGVDMVFDDYKQKESFKFGTKDVLENVYYIPESKNRAKNFQDFVFKSIGLVVTELEVSRDATLQVLKRREEELRDAERAAQGDWQAVQVVNSIVFRYREELETARKGQNSRQNDIDDLRKQLFLQAKDLSEGKICVREHEHEIHEKRRVLSRKRDELGKMNAAIIQKDDALSSLAWDIKFRERRLHNVQETVEEKTLHFNAVETSLKQIKDQVRRSEENRFLEEDRAQKAENMLQLRALACTEIKGDQADIAEAQASNLQLELELSNANIEMLRQELSSQDLHIAHQRKELLSKTQLLESRRKSLEAAMAKVNAEKDQVNTLKTSYQNLEQQLNQEKNSAQLLQLELQKGKGLLQNQIEEVNDLRKELQKKDSAYSDTLLCLQMKQAELLTIKLEIGQVKCQVSCMQLALSQKDNQLKVTNTVIAQLQKEVNELKAQVLREEEKYTAAMVLLKEKEDELKSLQSDLDKGRVKLGEVTDFIKQITSLAKQCKQEHYMFEKQHRSSYLKT